MKVGTGEADCISCGYKYEPKVGDPEYPINPNTRFQVRARPAGSQLLNMSLKCWVILVRSAQSSRASCTRSPLTFKPHLNNVPQTTVYSCLFVMERGYYRCVSSHQTPSLLDTIARTPQISMPTCQHTRKQDRGPWPPTKLPTVSIALSRCQHQTSELSASDF